MYCIFRTITLLRNSSSSSTKMLKSTGNERKRIEKESDESDSFARRILHSKGNWNTKWKNHLYTANRQNYSVWAEL